MFCIHNLFFFRFLTQTAFFHCLTSVLSRLILLCRFCLHFVYIVFILYTGFILRVRALNIVSADKVCIQKAIQIRIRRREEGKVEMGRDRGRKSAGAQMPVNDRDMRKKRVFDSWRVNANIEKEHFQILNVSSSVGSVVFIVYTLFYSEWMSVCACVYVCESVSYFHFIVVAIVDLCVFWHG